MDKVSMVLRHYHLKADEAAEYGGIVKNHIKESIAKGDDYIAAQVIEKIETFVKTEEYRNLMVEKLRNSRIKVSEQNSLNWAVMKVDPLNFRRNVLACFSDQHDAEKFAESFHDKDVVVSK